MYLPFACRETLTWGRLVTLKLSVSVVSLFLTQWVRGRQIILPYVREICSNLGARVVFVSMTILLSETSD